MKVISFLLVLFLSSFFKVEANSVQLNPNDFALKVCLDDNYEKIKVYQRENLRDYSSFNVGTPEQQLALSDFIKSNTKYFYKENLPIYVESSSEKSNAIFQKCMEFYKSDKLKRFIKIHYKFT